MGGLSDGDIVQISSLEDIYMFVDAYGSDFLVVPPEDLADRLASVLHMPGPLELNDWDGYIPVLVQGLGEMRLPFAMLCTPEDDDLGRDEDMGPTYVVEEVDSVVEDETGDIPTQTTYSMPSPDRRNPSASYELTLPADAMVVELSAITIQQAFRDHLACRPAIAMKRVSSQESLTRDMAADTIKSKLRERLSMRKGSAPIHSRTPKVPDAAESKDEYDYPPSRPPAASKSQERDIVHVHMPSAKGEGERAGADDKEAMHKECSERWDSKLGPAGADSKDEGIADMPPREFLAESVSIESRRGGVGSSSSSSNSSSSKRSRGPSLEAKEGTGARTPLEVAVPDGALRPPVTTKPKRERSKKAPTLRVIDRAFLTAKRHEANSLWLQHNELLILLDALGYAVKADGAPMAVEDTLGMEVSLRKPSALAAALSTFVRDTAVLEVEEVEAGPFSLPQNQAELAIGHLNALVDGNWSKARSAILRALTSGSGPKDGRKRSGSSDANDANINTHWRRPADWSDDSMSSVTSSLQLPGSVRALSAAQFLALSRSELRRTVGVVSSLLQARCLVYQRMLLLLDQWWDLGDVHPADSLPSVEVTQMRMSMTRSMSKGTFEAFMGKQAAAPPPVPDAAADAALAKASGGKKGRGGRRSRGVRARTGACVELEAADVLLDFWLPLNRAYGWGMPVDVLSSLANVLGGLKGRVADTRGDADDAPLPPLKGAQWVLLESIPGISVDALLADVGDCGVASPIRKCVAVPTSCVKRITPAQYAAAMRLSPGDVHVGLHVTAADAETLKLCCERFDWWDRPAPEVLEVLASRRAEVVSVAELSSQQRVGVQFVNPDGTEVLDALPLEALRPIIVEEQDDAEGEEEADAVGDADAKVPEVRRGPGGRRQSLSVTEIVEQSTRGDGGSKSELVHHSADYKRYSDDVDASKSHEKKHGDADVHGEVVCGSLAAQGKSMPKRHRPKSAKLSSDEAKADAVRDRRGHGMHPPAPPLKVPLKPYEYSWLRPEKVMELSAPPSNVKTPAELGLDHEHARGITVHSFQFGEVGTRAASMGSVPPVSGKSLGRPRSPMRGSGHGDENAMNGSDDNKITDNGGGARGANRGAIPLRDFTADMLGGPLDADDDDDDDGYGRKNNRRPKGPVIRETGSTNPGQFRYADDKTYSPDRLPGPKEPIDMASFGIIGEGRLGDRGTALAAHPDLQVRETIYRPPTADMGVKHMSPWGGNVPTTLRPGSAVPSGRGGVTVDLDEEIEVHAVSPISSPNRPATTHAHGGMRRQKSLNNSIKPFPEFENTVAEVGGRPAAAVIGGRIVKGHASPGLWSADMDDDVTDRARGKVKNKGTAKAKTQTRPTRPGTGRRTGDRNSRHEVRDDEPALDIEGVATTATTGRGQAREAAALNKADKTEEQYVDEQRKRSMKDGLAYKDKMLRRELKRMGVGAQ